MVRGSDVAGAPRRSLPADREYVEETKDEVDGAPRSALERRLERLLDPPGRIVRTEWRRASWYQPQGLDEGRLGAMLDGLTARLDSSAAACAAAAAAAEAPAPHAEPARAEPPAAAVEAVEAAPPSAEGREAAAAAAAPAARPAAAAAPPPADEQPSLLRCLPRRFLGAARHAPRRPQ